MIFRQLFEPESSTYSYLIGCESTRQAAIVDPVLETVDVILSYFMSLGSRSSIRSRHISTGIISRVQHASAN